jgi:preprotein translocase subunit YajC
MGSVQQSTESSGAPSVGIPALNEPIHDSSASVSMTDATLFVPPILAQNEPPSGPSPSGNGGGTTGGDGGGQTTTAQDGSPQSGQGTGGPGGQPQQGPGGLLGSPIILMLLVIVVLWIFLMGGNRKEKKRRQQMLASLGKGDRVQTVGGILGTIVEVRDDELVVKVDENTNSRLRFARSAIQAKLEDRKSEEVKQS